MRPLGRVLLLCGLLLTLSSLLIPFAGCSLYYVASGSMEPYLPVGSLVLLCNSQPSIGDVAAYSLYGSTVLHRVVSADQAKGVLTFAADVNPESASSIEANRVQGVAVLMIPYLGYIAMYRQISLAVLIFLVLLFSLNKMWKERAR